MENSHPLATQCASRSSRSTPALALVGGLLLALPLQAAELTATETKTVGDRQPNIVLIYADDLGYGDLGCYGGLAPTPNVDQLARESLRFTDAYATAATCTPSRYSILTGEYAFRRPHVRILRGDAAMLIQPGRPTLPGALQAAGYATAAVGKWHLGLGDGSGRIDWNRTVTPGPNAVGFTESFIMAATGDRVPCVYLRDGDVVGLDPADPIQVDYDTPFPGVPVGTDNREHLKMDWSFTHNNAVVHGIGRLGYMKGGSAALWVDEDMADTFTHEAVAFVERNRERPFFLYFATHDVHVPRVPHPRFTGASGMGPRGDAIVQFDHCVGAILNALDRHGLKENTIVLLSSDNGPVLNDGYADGANENLGSHRPAGDLRGGKYSLFEAGTRVPFLVRWPGRITPGVSEAVLSQVDLPATLSKLAGATFDRSHAPDTQERPATLTGEDRIGRPSVLLQSAATGVGAIALREGRWLYIPPSRIRAGMNPDTEVTIAEPGALFDLETDPGQQHDLAKAQPDRLQAMRARLATQVADPTTLVQSPRQNPMSPLINP